MNYLTSIEGDSKKWMKIHCAELKTDSLSTGNNSLIIGQGNLENTANTIGSIASGVASDGLIKNDENFGSMTHGFTQGGSIISLGNGVHTHGQSTSDSLLSAQGNSGTCFGSALSSSEILTTDSASFAYGFTALGSQIKASGSGSHASGYTSNNSTIRTSSLGSTARGYALNSSEILATANGAFSYGYTDNASITSRSLGSFAGGWCTGDSLIDSTQGGSRAIGVALSGGKILTDGQGVCCSGYTANGSMINSSNSPSGSMANGYTNNNAVLSVSARGVFAMGYCDNTDSLINGGAHGSLVGGQCLSGGKIESMGNGSMVFGHCSNSGIIESTNTGSMVIGECDGSGSIISAGNSGAFSTGHVQLGGSINASAQGCVAMGKAESNGSINAGHSGSMAHGRANGTDAVLLASAPGAHIFGYAKDAGVISITDGSSEGSMAYGLAEASGSEIITTRSGALLGGFVFNGGRVSTIRDGTLTGGYCTGADSTIETRAHGATSRGYSVGGAIMQAHSNGASAFGYGNGSIDFILSKGLGTMCTGRHTQNENDYSMLIGRYGIAKEGTINSSDTSNSILGDGSFQIAGGATASVTPGVNDGISVVLGTTAFGNSPVGGGIADFWNASGADYAEYFEWDDENTENEDRIGNFVSLINGEKIEYASNDIDVLGITVSDSLGTSSVIGDTAYKNWNKANLKDKYGRTSTKLDLSQPCRDTLEKHDVIRTDEIKDILENSEYDLIISDLLVLDLTSDDRDFDEEKCKEDLSNTTPIRLCIPNPEFDPSYDYIPREQRPEWCPIALLGKVYVKDNGLCVVGSKCSVLNGIAVPGDKYVVLSRSDTDVIKIMFK